MLVTCNNHHLTGKPEADGALIYIPPPPPQNHHHHHFLLECCTWLMFESVEEILYGVTIQMKATEQYFPVVLFIMLYKVVLTFESVDEILWCDHSNESY